MIHLGAKKQKIQGCETIEAVPNTAKQQKKTSMWAFGTRTRPLGCIRMLVGSQESTTATAYQPKDLCWNSGVLSPSSSSSSSSSSCPVGTYKTPATGLESLTKSSNFLPFAEGSLAYTSRPQAESMPKISSNETVGTTSDLATRPARRPCACNFYRSCLIWHWLDSMETKIHINLQGHRKHWQAHLEKIEIKIKSIQFPLFPLCMF